MKKINVLLLLLIYCFTITLGIVNAVQNEDTITIHYFRYDGNYTNYNMWIWQNEPVNSGGIQHDFNNDNIGEYGASYTFNLSDGYSGAKRLGIIIKQGGWEGYREPGGDRFINLDEVETINGVKHLYFAQGQTNIGSSEADLENNIPDYRPSVLFVAFDKDTNIVANLTHEAKSYKLYENGSLVIESMVTDTSKTLKITGLQIDIKKHYELEVLFTDSSNKKSVSLQNIYDTKAFENAFTYTGQLGVIYEKTKTTFRLWAPISEDVKLNIYNQGHPNYDRTGKSSNELTPVSTHQLTKIENGAWEIVLNGDYASKYYTFSVTNAGVTNEVTDPYSYSTGANGLRSMVVNFEETNPNYWSYEQRPDTIKSFTDYIIWELHVRDLTTHSSWQGTESYRGKFLGLSESNTTYTEKGVTVSTGLDHIEELGVNTVHLLPIFDFGYIDEVEVFKNPKAENVFNWGYMPYHFNTLEGSYSSNPFDGNVRIYEFKKAIQAMHSKNIRVVMDVVYNHTGESENSNFHKIIPGYYHRLNEQGGFSNGSGTGNETASERTMVRKFMVDSTVYLATEFKLSGFRFDLMSLHDIDTMNEIRNKMNEIDPTIILYGEPWTGGATLIDGQTAAGMTPNNNYDRTQIRKLDSNIAAFNDLYRNALKGNPDGAEGGFVQGKMDQAKYNDLKQGLLGATGQFTNEVTQNILYGEAHDNLTLHDKLRSSGVSIQEVMHAQIQSNAVVLTSLGIPFLHAGTEFLRSKPNEDGTYNHNSYESPDSVNQLRWDRKITYLESFNAHKALIHIRKSMSGLRIDNKAEVQSRLKFVTTSQDASYRALAYHIEGVNNEPSILVIHAGKTTGLTNVTLNDGKTYNMLTSRAGALPLYNTQTGLITRSGQFSVASANTTSIFVEVMGTEKSSIIKNTVEINENDTFNPLSNVKVASGSKAYASIIDTSISGIKVVDVNIVDYLGNIERLSYRLKVNGTSFNLHLGGL